MSLAADPLFLYPTPAFEWRRARGPGSLSDARPGPVESTEGSNPQPCKGGVRTCPHQEQWGGTQRFGRSSQPSFPGLRSDVTTTCLPERSPRVSQPSCSDVPRPRHNRVCLSPGKATWAVLWSIRGLLPFLLGPHHRAVSVCAPFSHTCARAGPQS